MIFQSMRNVDVVGFIFSRNMRINRLYKSVNNDVNN